MYVPLTRFAVVNNSTLIMLFLACFAGALTLLLILRKKIWMAALFINDKVERDLGKSVMVILIVSFIFWVLSLA